MKNTHMVHYAVACLEGLETPKAPQELSRTQRIPLKDCKQILRQFEAAGLVRENAGGQFERTRSIEDLTALEVLQALWSTPMGETCRMIYGKNGLVSDLVTRLAAQDATGPRG